MTSRLTRPLRLLRHYLFRPYVLGYPLAYYLLAGLLLWLVGWFQAQGQPVSPEVGAAGQQYAAQQAGAGDWHWPAAASHQAARLGQPSGK